MGRNLEKSAFPSRSHPPRLATTTATTTAATAAVSSLQRRQKEKIPRVRDSVSRKGQAGRQAAATAMMHALDADVEFHLPSPSLSDLSLPLMSKRTSHPDIQQHIYNALVTGRTPDVALNVYGSWEGVYNLHRVVLIQAVRHLIHVF